MIEIVLDENADNTFLNAERPVYTINDTTEKTWEEYRVLAQKILTAMAMFPSLSSATIIRIFP